MQVEGKVECLHLTQTGKRVSNTYATYLHQGDSSGKLEIIPHRTRTSHEVLVKATADEDGRASD